MKNTYNRLAAGDRLRAKRQALGMSQDEVAERIDRASKYYADIERGNCGMSIETLMALSDTMHMSLDYIIYGNTTSEAEFESHTIEVAAINDILNNSSERMRAYALRLLKLFIAANVNEHIVESVESGNPE